MRSSARSFGAPAAAEAIEFGTAEGTAAEGNDARITGAAQKASNLSDLASASTARTNLGLGTAATKDTGTSAGQVAAADDARITGAATAANLTTEIANRTAADALLVVKTANLSDLASAATARTNLGLGTAALLASGAVAQVANNLSDLASASTARTNLGLGGAAILAVGTSTGQVAAGDDSRITGAAQKASNLSDLASASTARTNLGLGTAAVLASSAVAQTANNLSDLASAATARTNLGLGTAAVLAAGGASGAATLDSASKLTPSQVQLRPNVNNGIQSGRYWVLPDIGSSTSASMTADRAYAIPVVLDTAGALTDFGIENVTVATAGNIRAGLYASSAGVPGTLVADYGTTAIPTGAAAMMWWTTSADVLAAFTLYFLVVVQQGATGSPTYRQRNTSNTFVNQGNGRPSTLSGSFSSYVTDTGFTGALPGSFGTVSNRAVSPAVIFKV